MSDDNWEPDLRWWPRALLVARTPHPYRGRSDRVCDVCGLSDRAAVHYREFGRSQPQPQYGFWPPPAPTETPPTPVLAVQSVTQEALAAALAVVLDTGDDLGGDKPYGEKPRPEHYLHDARRILEALIRQENTSPERKPSSVHPASASRNEIRDRFAHHPPTSDQVAEAHQEIRLRFTSLALYLAESVPSGRESSLAQTKLEEAAFWANAAVARTQLETPGSDLA